MTNCSRLGLPPKLATLATGYLATFRADITKAITKMVDELLQSPKLATIWNNANAKAHSDFVQIMQGEDPGQAAHHQRRPELGGDRRSSRNSNHRECPGRRRFPDMPVVFNIAGNADVQQVAGYYDLLDTLGTWLPILAVAAAAAVDPDRAQQTRRSVEGRGLAGGLDGGAHRVADHRAAMADLRSRRRSRR